MCVCVRVRVESREEGLKKTSELAATMEGEWLYLSDLSLQFADGLCPLLQSPLQLWDLSGSQL